MTNKKISDLNIATDGLTTDQLEVLRGGGNVRMTFDELMKVINALSQLASGIDFDADKIPMYDADTSATKYVLAELLQTEFHLACSVYSSSAQSIPNNSSTPLAFNHELFDTHGMHDNAVNNTNIVIPTAGDGLWIGLGMLTWSSSNDGIKRLEFFVNGFRVQYNNKNFATTGWETMLTVCPMVLAAGDIVTLNAKHDFGSAVNTFALVNTPFAVIFRIGKN